MSLPTWGDLLNSHCSLKWVRGDGGTTPNLFYEDMAARRYNYAPGRDSDACRLVFLKDVLSDPLNKTLIRNGRFIWCRNLQYEGREGFPVRQFSFTVDKGQKRFRVAENNVLSLPSKTFVNNNRYFRSKEKTFMAFSSVFKYKNTLDIMLKSSELEREDFIKQIEEDNPYRPGTLVAPRLGYFYPHRSAASSATDLELEHPYGIIIGNAFDDADYVGREFYRVKFGGTTYERVHPIQMEIINEV